MTTLYFSNWMVPTFVSVVLFMWLGLFILLGAFIYLAFIDKTVKKDVPVYLGIMVLFLGYFVLRPLWQVYFVRIEEDGTKILKNCYHITLGKIAPGEQFTLETKQKNLRGRAVQAAIIHVGEKTYTTVKSTPEQMNKATSELLQYK